LGKTRRDEPIIDSHFKSRKHDNQNLRVVEIVYLPSVEAEDRLRRAFDILLGPAPGSDQEFRLENKERPRQAPESDALPGGDRLAEAMEKSGEP